MGENDFDTNTLSSAPSRQATNSYVSIFSEKPQKFLLNAYKYDGGFRDGTYLVPYPIEGYYEARKEFSHYVNFYGPIVDAMAKPVFSSVANRQLIQGGKDVESDAWNAFLANCDGMGTPFHGFMTKAGSYMRAVSSHFIVVDNYKAEEQPEEMRAAIQNRVIPYVYHKTPCDLTGYGKDNRGALTWIMFYDRTEKDSSTEIRYHRKWTNEYSVEVAEKKEGAESTFEEVSSTMVVHGLGTIPVVMVRDRVPDSAQELLPEPRLYGVGRVCHAIFNKDSEMRELERRCEFPVLTMPGSAPADVSVGAGNLLMYPDTSTHSPAWISPDAATLLALNTTRGELREDLYRLAEQNGVVGVRKAASGVALSYDFKAYRETLEETATICEAAEVLVFNLFSLYMGLPETLVYVPGYNRDYMPTDMVERSNIYSTMLDSNPPPEVEKDIWRSMYLGVFPDAEQERFEEVNKSIEAHVDSKAVQPITDDSTVDDDNT